MQLSLKNTLVFSVSQNKTELNVSFWPTISCLHYQVDSEFHQLICHQIITGYHNSFKEQVLRLFLFCIIIICFLEKNQNQHTFRYVHFNETQPSSPVFCVYSITKAFCFTESHNFSPSRAEWNQFPFLGTPLVTNGSAVSSTPVYTSPTLLQLIHLASSFTNIKVPVFSNRRACRMVKQQHLFF